MRLAPTLAAALELASIPHPFSLDAYLEAVRAYRGRPLHMHDLPAAATGAVCGLWIATSKADHVFVAPGAAGVLRTNIVLHEISHMLLDHGKTGGDAETALARLLWPVVDGKIQAVAGRSRYDTVEERQAEQLATLILLRANDPGRGQDDGLRMIGKTFGYDLGGDSR